MLLLLDAKKKKKNTQQQEGLRKGIIIYCVCITMLQHKNGLIQ